MRRDVQALIVVLLGGALVRISLDGTYLRYLKPAMFWFLLAAGIFLIGLGLTSAWFDGLLRKPTPEVVAGEQAHERLDASLDGHAHEVGSHGIQIDDGHGHGAGGPRVAWLLLLPVLGVLFVVPPALGAYAADRGSVAAKPSEVLPDLAPGDPVSIPVSEFVTRAVWDAGRTLEGRTVELTGFAVVRDDGGVDLARLSLTCCAADAIAAKVELKNLDLPVASDQWLTVRGRWVPGGGIESPSAVPWIEVATAEAIEAPEQTYE